MSELRIATRGSPLALWQANHVRDRLMQVAPGLWVELLVLKTTGDRITDRPLSEVGGKGLFTKEIEEALLDGRAGVAVHSMKDMPSESPPGLCIGAVPHREDPRDALLLRPELRGHWTQESADGPLSALPKGAVLGTSSLRRMCQLRRLRPDLHIVPLRGNVDTRLRKLEAGEMDAMVLAVAGLARLGHRERIDAALSLTDSLPAVGQGALSLQCRENDAATRALLAQLHDDAAGVAVTAERAFLRRMQGDCKTPLAGYATLSGDEVLLDGLVGRPDGGEILREQVRGPRADAERLGMELADRLLARGGRALLLG